MGQRSKVSRLPWEVRQELERLWREGRYTIAELVEKLRALAAARGEPEADIPSKSGLHAYLKNFAKKLERYREAQEIAGMWISKIGEDPKGDVGRLAAEALKEVAIRAIDAVGEGDQPPGAKDVLMLAAALKELASADKLRTDLELKIRKELAQKVEHAIEETKRDGGGLSDDAADRIRAALMGKEPGKK